MCAKPDWNLFLSFSPLSLYAAALIENVNVYSIVFAIIYLLIANENKTVGTACVYSKYREKAKKMYEKKINYLR